MTENEFSGLSDTDIADALKTLQWFQTFTQRKLLLSCRVIEFAYKELINDMDVGRLEFSHMLGWCVEILQAGILTSDDISESGVTVRGQLCWYNHQQDISFIDAILLEHASLQILRIYFGISQQYSCILDKFLRASFKTLLEQNIYNSIGIFKLSYYTIYVPLAMAMILEGVSPKYQQLWKDVEGVSLNVVRFLESSASKFMVTNDNNNGPVTPRRILSLVQPHNEFRVSEICSDCLEIMEIQSYEVVSNSIKVVKHRGLEKVLDALLNNIYYRGFQ